jgi:hypothetical protein
MLSDKNQNSIADILENVDKTTKVLAERAPDLADAMQRCADRGAQRRHRRAARRRPRRQHQPLVNEQGKPAAEDLRKAIAGSSGDRRQSRRDDRRRAAGRQNFTKSTLPEANRLVRDLRDLSGSLQPSPSGSSKMARRRARPRETARLQAEERRNDALRLAAPIALPPPLLSLAGCFGGGKSRRRLLTLTRKRRRRRASRAPPRRARR